MIRFEVCGLYVSALVRSFTDGIDCWQRHSICGLIVPTVAADIGWHLGHLAWAGLGRALMVHLRRYVSDAHTGLSFDAQPTARTLLIAEKRIVVGVELAHSTTEDIKQSV